MTVIERIPAILVSSLPTRMKKKNMEPTCKDENRSSKTNKQTNKHWNHDDEKKKKKQIKKGNFAQLFLFALDFVFILQCRIEIHVYALLISFFSCPFHSLSSFSFVPHPVYSLVLFCEKNLHFRRQIIFFYALTQITGIHITYKLYHSNMTQILILHGLFSWVFSHPCLTCN